MLQCLSDSIPSLSCYDSCWISDSVSHLCLDFDWVDAPSQGRLVYYSQVDCYSGCQCLTGDNVTNCSDFGGFVLLNQRPQPWHSFSWRPGEQSSKRSLQTNEVGLSRSETSQGWNR